MKALTIREEGTVDKTVSLFRREDSLFLVYKDEQMEKTFSTAWDRAALEQLAAWFLDFWERRRDCELPGLPVTFCPSFREHSEAHFQVRIETPTWRSSLASYLMIGTTDVWYAEVIRSL